MAPAWPRRAQAADHRILVVDDSRAIHDQVHQTLTDGGYQDVYHAGSAQEAITFYEAKRPDLMLVDMLMPGADGATLCKEILSRHPHADLVVLTALPPHHPKVVDALAHGARAVVHKPVSGPQLLSVLQHAHAA